MKFTENAKDASNLLKSAVPELTKFKLPVNPYNYSLWYAHQSGEFAPLSQELQSLLKKDQTLSYNQSLDLFKRFIIDDFLTVDQKIEDNLQSVMTGMSESASKTEKSAGSLEEQLVHSLRHLENSDTTEMLHSVIQNIADKTKLVSQTTREFRTVLNDAQDEISRLKEELKEAKAAAHKDSLTQLFNRHHFDLSIEEAMAKRSKSDALALIIMDVDHFKAFNDNYGHLMGDLVLKAVGQVLLEASKDHDYIPCRYGGEEFAIVLPKTSMYEAKILADNTRKKISLLKLKDKKTGTPISNITASFGLTFAKLDDTSTTFIERADQALYKAKENGRNQVVSL